MKKNTVRLNIDVSLGQLANMKRVRAMGGHTTMTATVRHALAVYLAVLEQKREGFALCFRDINGTVREFEVVG